MSNTTQDINHSIKRIREVSFSINEKFYIPDPDKMVKIQLGYTIGINFENSLVNFTLRMYLHYIDTPEKILAEMQIENIFEVPGLQKLSEGRNDYLSPQLLLSIIDNSVSHGRALFATKLSGTPFQEIILPITKPIDVALIFFPEIFGESNERGLIPSVPAKNKHVPKSGKNISKNTY
jgi:hypothetical protein